MKPSVDSTFTIRSRTVWALMMCWPFFVWCQTKDQHLSTNYPNKPIKIVVALSAGGPTDTLARIISQALSARLGQPLVIDNRPGGGGNIGAEWVAKSAPDGYTLLMGTSGPLSINSSLYPKMGFDPIKDFSPIALLASAPFVVALNPKVPIKTIAQLITYAREHPAQLNYGAVSGNAAHLATELFKSSANVDLTFIPYKGAAPANNDLIAGQIDLSFASTPGVIQFIENGKLSALAVTSAHRIRTLPKVPTLQEAGIADYEASVWYGMVAPTHTPKVIVERLNMEVLKSLSDPAIRDQMINNDFDPIGSSPEEFGRFIQSESIKWGKVVKTSGAHVD
jgi:tripartite-type tricarboxylate transporter receptor subunit TctC